MFKLIKGLVSLAMLLVLVIVIVSLFSLGSAANHDQKSSKNVAPLWSRIQIGDTEDEVRTFLGKPDDATTSTSDNFEGGTDTYDTWTYGTLADTTYSLDFTNGRLTSKLKM